MPLSIVRQLSADLPAYGSVPIAFAPTHRWHGGPVEMAFTKDYDSLPQNRPVDWPRRFDLSGWRFAAAFLENIRVGGVAVILKGCEIEESAELQDAVLWDLRVHPEHRRQGVGRELLRWAETEAISAGRARLLAETQDINPAACNFYSANGYACMQFDAFSYPELPNEARLVWMKCLIHYPAIKPSAHDTGPLVP